VVGAQHPAAAVQGVLLQVTGSLTIRELLYNSAQRRRSDQTLTALSQALGWPPDYLQAIADGRTPDDPDAGDPVLAELAALKDALTAITSRIDAIEQQLADGGEQS
jgi:hypothetical protein